MDASILFGLPADALNAYAALATAVIASLALVGAVGQIIVGKREARLAVAKSIYREYLALAFANPKYSSAAYPKKSPRMHAFRMHSDQNTNYETYEQYEFYVSNMLFAAEEILDITHNKSEWRTTLRDQLKYHALYLQSLDMPETHYGAKLLTLRDEAVEAYNSDEPTTN